MTELGFTPILTFPHQGGRDFLNLAERDAGA